jgi:hypothetical protein
MRFEDLTETVKSEVFSGDQQFYVEFVSDVSEVLCGVCIGRFRYFLLLLKLVLL